LALSIHNEVEIHPSAQVRIRVQGEGEGSLGAGESNLIWRTFSKYLRLWGQDAVGAEIICINRIPLARGLGSSAAARVAALVAANAWSDSPFRREQLVEFAAREEGHPDNVAPALLGGLVVSGRDGEKTVAHRVDPRTGIRVVLLIPERTLATAEARRVLPKSIPLGDAVLNLQNTALTALAFASGEYELLRSSLEDRLHQPSRAPLMPGFQEALKAAVDAGALGAALSGAGPAVAAFTLGNEAEIGQAMSEAYTHSGGGPCRWTSAEIDREGVRIETINTSSSNPHK
jgi:homoserine kinase